MSYNETLAARLIGKYQLEPDAESEHRDFSDSEFIKPINIEASNRIKELEGQLEAANVSVEKLKTTIRQYVDLRPAAIEEITVR